MAEIRRVVPEEWEELRNLRLASLRDAPHAFGSTYDHEVGLGVADWLRRIGERAYFLAWDESRAVGMSCGTASFDGVTGERSLVAMWVHPDVRGTRVAHDLVAAMLDWADRDGASVVRAWVTDGNERARRFYLRMGFTPTGRRQPVPRNPNLGEEQLEISLPVGP